MSNKITTIEKLVDRIYTEDDFGRSVATSLSGLVGLLVYIFTNDWVIALFSTVITFPIIRIIFTKLDIKLTHKRQQEASKKEIQEIYTALSSEEKKVIELYVIEGGSVLTWSHINHSSILATAIESLIQRQILRISLTADGMTETFVLDLDIFDIANKEYRNAIPF